MLLLNGKLKLYSGGGAPQSEVRVFVSNTSFRRSNCIEAEVGGLRQTRHSTNHPSIADIVEGYSVLDHFLGSRVNTVSDRMESAEAVVGKLIEIENSTERGKRFSEYVLERLKQTSRSYFTEWLRFLLQFLEVLSKLLEEYAECSKREGVLQSYLRFLLGCADYKAFVINHNPLTVCKDKEEYGEALKEIDKSPNGTDTVIMNTFVFIHDTLTDAGLDMCAEFGESAPRNTQYMFGLIDDAVYHHELAGIFQVDLLHAFCDHKGEARKRALILLAQNVGNLILHEVQTLQDGYAVDLSSLRTDVFNRGSIPKHRTASLSSETKLLNILMNEFKKEMRSLRLRKGDDTDDARKDLGQNFFAARAKLRILHTYQSRLQALVAHQQLNPMTLASMERAKQSAHIAEQTAIRLKNMCIQHELIKNMTIKERMAALHRRCHEITKERNIHEKNYRELQKYQRIYNQAGRVLDFHGVVDVRQAQVRSEIHDAIVAKQRELNSFRYA